MFIAGCEIGKPVKVLSAALLCFATWGPSIAAAQSTPPPLSNANRLIIERGLLREAWYGNGMLYQNGNPDNSDIPTRSQLAGFHLTGPTFYSANGSDMMDTTPFDPAVLSQLSANQGWALAQAPHGQNVDAGTEPTPYEQKNGYLPEEALPYVNRFFSVQFGDENNYSDTLVETYKSWFAVSRRHYPKALVHASQLCGQWDSNQLGYYVQIAHPDILTCDIYPFDGPPKYVGTYSDYFDVLNQNVRLPALKGWDGTGRDPIAFGSFLQGFAGEKSGSIPSESQILLQMFANWTIGAKWTSVFRWTTAAEGTTNFFYLSDGSPSPAYHHLAEGHRMGQQLSPYLVRMNSSAVYYVPAGDNPQPDTISNLPEPTGTSGVVRSAIAVNRGGANGGSAGDVAIGYFTPIPNLGTYVSGWGLPSGSSILFTAPGVKSFMVQNAFAVDNTDPTNPTSTGGTGAETAQAITITLNPRDIRDRVDVWRIDRTTGKPVQVFYKDTAFGLEFTDDLPGGVADLFFVTPRGLLD